MAQCQCEMGLLAQLSLRLASGRAGQMGTSETWH